MESPFTRHCLQFKGFHCKRKTIKAVLQVKSKLGITEALTQSASDIFAKGNHDDKSKRTYIYAVLLPKLKIMKLRLSGRIFNLSGTERLQY